MEETLEGQTAAVQRRRRAAGGFVKQPALVNGVAGRHANGFTTFGVDKCGHASLECTIPSF